MHRRQKGFLIDSAAATARPVQLLGRHTAVSIDWQLAQHPLLVDLDTAVQHNWLAKAAALHTAGSLA